MVWALVGVASVVLAPVVVLVVVVLALVGGIAAGVDDAGAQGTVPAGGDAPPVLVVGHRGASKDAPEHTGAAYDRAVAAGVDVLECDLQLTADEELVCLHDTTVDRTTGGAHTGRVDSFTLAELRAMDMGSWFGPGFANARIVTLDEQLDCYGSIDPDLRFYLETKAPAEYSGRMEPLLVDTLREHGLVPDGPRDVRRSRVIVQSFDASSLASVRSLAPTLPTAFLFVAPGEDIAAGRYPDVDILAPGKDLLAADPGLVAAGHAAGKEVHTWTVDEPAEMQSLIAAGIDGFFTNDPSTARREVDAAGRSTGRRSSPIDGTASSPGCAPGLGVGLTAVVAEGPGGGTSSTVGSSPAGSLAGRPTNGGGSLPSGEAAADSGAGRAEPTQNTTPVAVVGGVTLLVIVVTTAIVLARRRSAPPPGASPRER